MMKMQPMKPNDANASDLKLIAQDEEVFSDVVRLIAASREKAIQSVNTALIELYWEVGAMISRKIEAAEWGDGVVDQLAQFIARTEPTLRGFTRRNLFRMRQFYEAYREDPIVSPLVTQLPWSHHLIILGGRASARKSANSISGLPFASGGASANWSASSRQLCSSAQCSARQKCRRW